VILRMNLPTAHIPRHICLKGQSMAARIARPTSRYATRNGHRISLITGARSGIRLFNLIIAASLSYQMALQSLQAVDYPFVSLPAPMQVLVMPTGLVVPQMLHLGGQLAEAVDQSGQRNGHHD